MKMRKTLDHAFPASVAEEKKERRTPSRQRVLLRGVLAFASSASNFDCCIRNLSAKGARITCKTMPSMLPADVYVINLRDRMVYQATVAWTRGHDAGLVFKKIMRFSEIDDPALSHLSQVWMSKTAG
jgi:hypothetical protein